MSEERTRLYRVSFNTTKGGLTHWNFDINAKNMTQACEIAKERWYEWEHREAHMFRLTVERIQPDQLVHCGYFRMIY